MRRFVFERMLSEYKSVILRERAEQKAINRELDERNKLIGAARRDRVMQRKAQARDRHDYYTAVLSAFSGPGGSPRYASKEEAAYARRLYLRAYGCLYAKTAKGLAIQRRNSAVKRLSGVNRSPGRAQEFYYNMLLDKHAECFYCKRELAVHERYGDHFVPLSRGGLHTNENLVIACSYCNTAKSNMMPDEFIESRRSWVTWP